MDRTHAGDFDGASLRQAHADVVKYDGDTHGAARQLVAAGRDLYARALLPTSPFSAMAVAFVARYPLPPVA